MVCLNMQLVFPQSYEHYDLVDKEIDNIIEKSKNPQLSIADIEGLLKRLEVLKGKEAEQEKRLQEIERISKIIFGRNHAKNN